MLREVLSGLLIIPLKCEAHAGNIRCLVSVGKRRTYRRILANMFELDIEGVILGCKKD